MNEQIEKKSCITWEEWEDGEVLILRQYDEDGEEIGDIRMTRNVAIFLAKEFLKNLEDPEEND